VKTNIQNEIINSLDEWKVSRDKYNKMGVPYKKGYLFYGPPGNGKSSAVYAIAHYMNMNVFSVLSLSHLKQVIHNLDNCIIFFDDFNVLYKDVKRDSQSGNKQCINEASLIMKTLLDLFDGYSKNGLIYVITTNNKALLDDALIIPGRIDHQIEFKNCNADQFKRIYKDFTNSELPHDYKFEDGKYSSAYVINTVVLPNIRNTKTILDMLCLA